MSTAFAELMSFEGWIWASIPVLCLLLIHFGDQPGRVRGAVASFVAAALAAFATMAMSGS